MEQPGSGEFSQRWRVARACARCHRLKSKCVYEDPAHDSCRRCFSLNIQCSIEEDPTAQTAKRRKMMKLPVRSPGQILSKVRRLLADAEREFERMESGVELGDVPLEEAREAASAICASAERLREKSQECRSNLASGKRGEDQEGKENQGRGANYGIIHAGPGPGSSNHGGITHRQNLINETSSDITASPYYSQSPETTNAVPKTTRAFLSSLITESEARARYAYYHEHMAGYFPVLTLPTELQNFTSALDSSPLLVLACIYVTSTSDRRFSPKEANRKLSKSLIHYLDNALAQTIYVEAADLSYHIVFACMILSLWGVPPPRVHQYKSQIELITAYSVSVCIDAGNVSNIKASGGGEEIMRNNLRSFLAVYCCCGSLNFSLPRFNFAKWSPRHEVAVEILSSNSQISPSSNDTFLCFYSKVIRVGKQLSDFLTENGVSMNLLTSEEERGGLAGLEAWNPQTHSRQFIKLAEDLAVYERNLTGTVNECGILEDSHSVSPGERVCLLLTYYHLVMMIYDNLVSWCIYHLTADSRAGADGMERYFPEQDKSLILDHIVKFGEMCEKILDCFIEFNPGGVTEYPTFFYYRAVASLISLIRLSILVKSDISQHFFPEIRDVKFRLRALYAEVSRIVETSKVGSDSRVCERFSNILGRIGRWVQVVETNDRHRPHQNGDVDFLKLTDMSKGQEVEKFVEPMSRPDENKAVAETSSITKSTIGDLLVKPENTYEDIDPSATNFSIQEMFKEIDEDIIRYLNPFDTMDASFSLTLN